MAYTVERTGPDVLTLRHDPYAVGWEQRYLLVADVHFDNPHCDHNLLRRHFDQAVEAGAGILSIGDWFDAMGSRNDPRRSKTGLRNEHNEDDYLDRLVDDAAAWLEPYRGHLVMMGDGNHETAIRRNLETDLLARLCRRLGVAHMGYSGFVRFMFSATTGGRTQQRLFFHHGDGGGGAVTRGVIGTNRRAVYMPDADVVVTGHIHEAWTVEVPRVRLNDTGRIYRDRQIHIQLATYKDEYVMTGGYHIEKGRAPKPLGGWWLTFRYRHAMPRVYAVTERAI